MPRFQPRIKGPEGRAAFSPGNSTGVLDFPGAALGDLLINHQKKGSQPSSARIRGREVARLRAILPPGRYRFSGSCALELAAGRLRPLPICLGSEGAAALLSELRVDSPNPSYYSSPGSGRRSFHGIMTLLRAHIDDRGVSLHWVAEELIYANPYLEALRRRFPHLPEETRLNSAYVSLVLPELLMLATEERDTVRLGEVLKPGESLYFSKECPLRVLDGPARAPAEVRLRLTLSMSCPAGGRLGRMSIILPAETVLADSVRAGARLTGHVRLAGIVRDGRQLRMVWDSISNIRVLD